MNSKQRVNLTAWNVEMRVDLFAYTLITISLFSIKQPISLYPLKRMKKVSVWGELT